ncbi:restriction endonuclease subunit S [Pseudaestuariivita rosea]|uniref:restriction endonuclease subunit S n=1 Tax=Pseudaestuariivita rosea TaxID=2763263 RepID=UPI001ABB6119|nr:restriction endonuclease subunit S [Pseudaestuariivita rosea]
MSDLSFLEKLLDGAAVEWKSVSDIFHVKNGYTPSKSNKAFWEHGTVPWFRMDDIRENGRVLSQSLQNITEDAVKGGKLFPANSMIFATSATIGEHALVTVPYLANQRFTNLALKDEYTESFDRKFLFYYGFLLADWSKNNTTKSSFASVDMDGFRKFPVPIPCPEDPEKSLAIQAEIVRILDSFTELTAELKARKQQYNHYREQLLDYEGQDVEHLPMGDERVGSFTRGGGLQKKDFAESGVGCIHYGQVYTHYGTYAHTTKSFVSEEFAKKARMAKPGDLVIATTSENDEDVCKAVAWLGDEDIAVSSDACFYSHKLNPKFVAYFFQTEQFQKQKRVHITGAKVRRVNADNLAKILIPVPSAEEQDRVVEILDTFDTLTTSLSEGLPREIKLRQQQYEYYRDLLLSFPKPEEAAL